MAEMLAAELHVADSAGAEHPEARLDRALERVLPRLEGAFSLVLMDAERIIGVRDPNGLRPLCLGRLDDGWVLASESPALDIVGAKFDREVEPGEVVIIGRDGPRSLWPFPAERINPTLCLFEFVYFARPDSQLYGQSVHHARVRQGELLAEQAPLPEATPYPDAEGMVMGVPESGVPAAEGYARASGIPFGQGLVKNRYIGRTFIAPEPGDAGARRAHEVQPAPGEHRRPALVVVDDSVVRGTTQKQLVKMLREAGALEVHLRLTSPPVRWPCFYGMDFGDTKQLLAANLDVEGIRTYLGVDTLSYIDLDRLLASTGADPDSFCSACFTGDYPLAGPRRAGQGRARDRRSARHRSGLLPLGQRGDGGGVAAARRRGAPRRTADRCRARRPGRDLSAAMGHTYEESGVDIAAGEEAVERIKEKVRSTFRPEVIGDIGGFGGLFSFAGHRYRHPVLVSSTDGVGTKALIAQATGRFDTIGIDLVAMCVDDLVCQGAEPLFFLDYIAVGKLDPDHIEQLVEGVAEGCRQAGCALIGGEMAEHPGAMEPGEFDLVGFAVGVVERDQLLSGDAVRPGDVLIGLPSPGLRSNGYSLARRVFFDAAGRGPRRAGLRGRPPQPGRRAARAVGDLQPRPCRRCSGRSTCTPPPTSPAAGSPRTWPGCCPATSTRSSTAAPGSSPGSSPRSSGSGRSPTTRWPRCSTSASA